MLEPQTSPRKANLTCVCIWLCESHLWNFAAAAAAADGDDDDGNPDR